MEKSGTPKNWAQGWVSQVWKKHPSVVREFTQHRRALFAKGVSISGTAYDIQCRVPAAGSRGEIYRKACREDRSKTDSLRAGCCADR
jgi:hypothetical protein